jgi:two-component system, LytTR family, response regulator
MTIRVALVDDEQPFIDELSYLLGKYPDIEIVAAFTNPLTALESIENIKPDVVFLDIDMPYMNGLELALRIQEQCPGIIIVFVTAYSQYALDSFKAYPLDYLLKPVKEARLDEAVKHVGKQFALMHPEMDNAGASGFSGGAVFDNTGTNNPATSSATGLRITCFGKFDLRVPGNNGDIKWGTRRVKELFMYLIDCCGATPSRTELVDGVFGGVDDKKTANNIYVTVYKLRSLLDSIGSSRARIRLKKDYTLQIEPGVCDYIDFIEFARKNATITSHNAGEAARVLSYYNGSYLEDVDQRWVADSAAEVETEYERISLGLANAYVAQERDEEAEKTLLALLVKNPLCDDAHRNLLDLYMKKGNDKAFAARFLEYARMLKAEFGDEPPTKYLRHYNTSL